MPEFKLFGKTIQVSARVAVSLADEAGCNGDDEQPPLKKRVCPDHQNSNTEEEEGEEEEEDEEEEEVREDESNTPANKAVVADEEQNQSNNNLEDKSPQKPDKILPCPRCKSMDTKFCYFNNYNVNQPRHFCKNCQRYWTAGGSIRNVPVGAGRRKSKCSCPTLIPDLVQADPGSIRHLQPPKSNGMLLSFGPDAPLGESMTSAMNHHVEKTKNYCEQLRRFPNSNDEGKESANSNCYDFTPAAHFNGSNTWPYPWSPPPPFCVPSFSFPLYPMNSYWGMPWLLPQLSTSLSSASSGSNSNSTVLGKHSREGNLMSHNNSDPINPDNCIWIPKTRTADGHEKAAKCQAWTTMEFKNDGVDTISRGEGLFKAFQSSGGQKVHSSEVSHILLANPAAVSRSFCFQES